MFQFEKERKAIRASAVRWICRAFSVFPPVAGRIRNETIRQLSGMSLVIDPGLDPYIAGKGQQRQQFVVENDDLERPIRHAMSSIEAPQVRIHPP